MKKYVKPELIVEKFELTTQIAACAFDHMGTLTDINQCCFTQDGSDIVVFTSTNGRCEWTPEDIGVVGDGECYYTGGSETTSPALGLFNS